MRLVIISRPIELIPSNIDEKFFVAIKKIFKIKFKTKCKSFGNIVIENINSLPSDIQARIREEKEKFYLVKLLYPLVFKRYKSLKLTNRLKKWIVEMNIGTKKLSAILILHDDYPFSAPWKLTSDIYIHGKKFEMGWRDLDPDKCLGRVPKMFGLSSDSWNYRWGIIHFLALAEVMIRTRWETKEHVII